MTRKISLDAIVDAAHIILNAFAYIGETRRTAVSPVRGGKNRLFDVDSLRPSGRQSLRWSLPFVYSALVYISFSWTYSSVKAEFLDRPRLGTNNIFAAEMNGTQALAMTPILKSAPSLVVARDEHLPDHGDDPHGVDPHEEQHDPELPGNVEPPDTFEKKDSKYSKVEPDSPDRSSN